MLDEKHLSKFIEERKVKGEVIEFQQPVIKSDEAFKVTGGKIVKTILLMVDEKPILCILDGNKKVNFDRVKKIKNAKEVRLAKAKEVKEISGYDIGALPPFGHKNKIETIIDKNLLKSLEEFVYCGGGSHYHLLKISVKELIEFSGGKIEDISL